MESNQVSIRTQIYSLLQSPMLLILHVKLSRIYCSGSWIRTKLHGLTVRRLHLDCSTGAVYSIHTFSFLLTYDHCPYRNTPRSQTPTFHSRTNLLGTDVFLYGTSGETRTRKTNSVTEAKQWLRVLESHQGLGLMRPLRYSFSNPR